MGACGLVVLMSQAEPLTIVESFVGPTNGLSLCDSVDETPGAMLGSGFRWGGYTYATASGWRGKINISGGLQRLELYSNVDSDASISANYNGTYLYTIFDTNGTATASQSIDLSQTEIDVAGAAPGQSVRWLVRDVNSQWYLSAVATAVESGTTAFNASSAGTGWLRVDAAAESEMNELDADAKREISDPLYLDASTPDLSAVTGGGLYIESGDVDESAQHNFIVTEMRWSGTTLEVIEEPSSNAVPVVVDVMRKRTINGQLAVNRKNLFNVHATDSSFSTAQKNYLFNQLDTYVGRTFGVLWKMKQIPEDSGRPGYWDDAKLNAQANSAYNSWVNDGSPEHNHLTDMIMTSHSGMHFPTAEEIAAAPPNGFRTRDHDANAEFVSLYMQQIYPRLSWYELSNEINGEAGHLDTTWNEISTLFKTIADRLHDDDLGIKVVGFGGKWPAFEHSNFGIWNRDWVEFIDVAGSSMDAYSVHLYSRMGANAEAIMDMINNYSMIRLGETKPLMITEFGHLPDTTDTFEKKLWLNMQGQNAFFFQFLERGGLMGRSIPFNTANATTWASAMLVESPAGSGTMVWTDMIKLYEVWKDFRGERIAISSGDPDLLVHALQDGAAVHIAMHNFSDEPMDVALSRLTGNASVAAADISRLYWSGASATVSLNTYLNPEASALTLSGREVVVLTLQLSELPVNQLENADVSYFGHAMIQPITGGVSIGTQINGVDTSSYILNARLRISSGNVADWLPSSVMVNGTEVFVPVDQLGDAADALRAYEVEVPAWLLTTNNEIQVTYAASGGHLAGAVLDVAYGDPLEGDSDSDGLSDAFEMYYGGGPESMDPLAGASDDGLTTLAEFAMGLNPMQNNSTHRPTHSFTNFLGSDYLSITYRRAAEAMPYLDLYVLRSTNLMAGVGWQTNQTQVGGFEVYGSDVESVTEQSLVPVSESSEEYLKVEVRSK